MDVTAEQRTQVPGILARPAASAFMGQEFDPVNVGKQFRHSGLAGTIGKFVILDLCCLAFAIQSHQLGNLPAIYLRGGEAQFLFKRLL